MKRSVLWCEFLVLLTISLAAPSFGEEALERHQERKGVGESLMGLQKGVQGVVVGFFGIGEHATKFLFYGTRDGFRTLGREAQKADQSLQKNLW